jgi:hypothetical protein
MEMERFVWFSYGLLSVFFWWNCRLIFLPLLQKIVDSIEQQPAAEVVLGEHVFLSVGDYYVAAKSA